MILELVQGGDWDADDGDEQGHPSDHLSPRWEGNAVVTYRRIEDKVVEDETL